MSINKEDALALEAAAEQFDYDVPKPSSNAKKNVIVVEATVEEVREEEEKGEDMQEVYDMPRKTNGSSSGSRSSGDSWYQNPRASNGGSTLEQIEEVSVGGGQTTYDSPKPVLRYSVRNASSGAADLYSRPKQQQQLQQQHPTSIMKLKKPKRAHPPPHKNKTGDLSSPPPQLPPRNTPQPSPRHSAVEVHEVPAAVLSVDKNNDTTG